MLLETIVKAMELAGLWDLIRFLLVARARQHQCGGVLDSCSLLFQFALTNRIVKSFNDEQQSVSVFPQWNLLTQLCADVGIGVLSFAESPYVP
jgi:hypothetical protein